MILKNYSNSAIREFHKTKATVEGESQPILNPEKRFRIK